MIEFDNVDARPTPSLAPDHRIRAAYFTARQRPNAPAELLDREFVLFQARLQQYEGRDIARPNVGVAEAVDALRANATALFEKWASMPEDQIRHELHRMAHPQPLLVPPEVVISNRAQGLVGMLERQGFRFELHGKTFRVEPGSKLSAADRETLTELKAPIMTVLSGRVDVWSPG